MNSSLLARPLRAKAVSCLAPLCIARRNIVYVRDGKTTVRGLKKNEDDYLTASNGVKYPGNIDTLKPAKEFLGDEYALEDSLILQAITHKSFAHGKKPYNEKLAVIGREFLRLQSMAYAVKNDKSTYAVQLVNGVNFEAHKNGAVRQIFASKTGYELCKRAGIDRSIFWKKPTDVSFADASCGCWQMFCQSVISFIE
jgi:large subunit ribosomal protein L15